MKTSIFAFMALTIFVFSSCTKTDDTTPLVNTNSKYEVYAISVDGIEQLQTLFDGVDGIPVTAIFTEEMGPSSGLFLEALWDSAFSGGFVPPTVYELGHNFTWTRVSEAAINIQFKDGGKHEEVYAKLNGDYIESRINDGVRLKHASRSVTITLKNNK